MSWWETLHLVTWWKRLGISAIKTGQDAPSWIWCTERLSFFWGGHIVLQRFVHVRCHFQPLPTKLVFAYFDRGSYVFNICKYSVTITCTHNSYNLNQLCIGRTSRNTQQLPSNQGPMIFFGVSLMTSYASSTHVVAIATFLSADPAVFLVYQKIWIQEKSSRNEQNSCKSLSEFKAFLKISVVLS